MKMKDLTSKAKITAIIRRPDGKIVRGEANVEDLSFEDDGMRVICVTGKAYIVGKQIVALILEEKENAEEKNS